MKLAQDYSDLDISDIDISHQKRISRPKKTFRNNYSSASDSDDSDQNNNTISENKKKTLPAPPSLPKSFIANKSTNNEIISEEFYPILNKNIIKEASDTSDTPGKS